VDPLQLEGWLGANEGDRFIELLFWDTEGGGPAAHFHGKGPWHLAWVDAQHHTSAG